MQDAVALPSSTAPIGNRALRRFGRHRLAVFGLLAIALLILASVVGPSLIPFDELHIDIRSCFAPPLIGLHVLGTDQLGRDLAARLLTAGPIRVGVGFAARLISIVIGTVIGAVAGYYGGWLGAVLMRIVDAVLCFPSVFLLLALAAFIKPSVPMITLIIAATAWMEVARVVQNQVRSLRERDFATAALMIGASDATIMFRELVPNVIGAIVVAATLTVARAILMES